MTMSLPAFAVEFENKGNNTDIQFKKIMESVYEQLVAQNAEDMYPVYEEIISAQYYNQLALTKKGPVSTLGDEDEVYRYAPYGGSVTYKLPREWGVEPLRVGMLCLDDNKTGKYVIDLLASGDSLTRMICWARSSVCQVSVMQCQFLTSLERFRIKICTQK